jgi:hypothetical protein
MTTGNHALLKEMHVRGVSAGAPSGMGTGSTNELLTIHGVEAGYMLSGQL